MYSPTRRNRLLRLLPLIILPLLFSYSYAQYIPPASNRATQGFNLDWKYYQGDVTGAEATSYNDGAWAAAVLPHYCKWITPDNESEYLGIAWYRKHFTLSSAYQGRKVFVEFEGAMQWAQVWVNGVSKGTYEGGYMGFVFDITNEVSFTEENVIAVKIDTRANANWAPGKAAVDFRYYGGLYRDAWLHITDPLHVTHALFANVVAGGGVFVTYTAVSPSSATLSVKTHVQNEGTAPAGCTVISDIVDAAGSIAGTATSTATIAAGTSNSFTQTITISNPRLWNHLAPNLYTLHTTVRNGTTTVDHVATRTGIRRIAWSRTSGISINGTYYKLRGTDEHQDIYGLGNSIPNKAIFYEVKMIKEAGFDFIRCAHYPHDPSFYDACDSLGILVMNCLTGWQNWVNSTAFMNNTYKECREMVRRDRNHPCVVTWETSLNETSGYTTAWATNQHNYAHAEYPGDQMFTNGYRTTIFDIFSEAAAHAALYTDVTTRAVIVAEYGDWEYGGLTSTSRVHREGTDAALLQQAYNHQQRMNMLKAYSWFSVDNLWSYGDNGSAFLAGTFYGGATDMYRLPKFTYYFFRSQRNATESIPGVSMGPMVYIANTWQSSSPTAIRVFSNCDSVSLYRNGTLIATRAPDTDTASTRINHPPFTFSGVTFASGTIRADGKIGSTVRATHSRITPGTAAAVQLRPISSDPIATDGSEARLVWIDVIDANGTVVPTSTASVTLSISGPATILGTNPVTMKGGQLATWIRAGTVTGAITLVSSSSGLTPDTVVLNGTTGTIEPPRLVGHHVLPVPFAMVQKDHGLSVYVPENAAKQGSTFTLFNAQGRLAGRWILTKNITCVDINSLPHGVYLGQISAGTYRYLQKIVRQ